MIANRGEEIVNRLGDADFKWDGEITRAPVVWICGWDAFRREGRVQGTENLKRFCLVIAELPPVIEAADERTDAIDRVGLRVKFVRPFPEKGK